MHNHSRWFIRGEVDHEYRGASNSRCDSWQLQPPSHSQPILFKWGQRAVHGDRVCAHTGGGTSSAWDNMEINTSLDCKHGVHSERNSAARPHWTAPFRTQPVLDLDKHYLVFPPVSRRLAAVGHGRFTSNNLWCSHENLLCVLQPHCLLCAPSCFPLPVVSVWLSVLERSAHPWRDVPALPSCRYARLPHAC